MKENFGNINKLPTSNQGVNAQELLGVGVIP